MARLILGSWTASLGFPSARHASAFFNHHAGWISDRAARVRCDLTAPGPGDIPRTLPTRFACHAEGSVLSFDLGALRITVDPTRSPWTTTASLPALLDFLGRTRTRLGFSPTGQLLHGTNLVLRVLAQVWTAFHNGLLLHASAVADRQGRVHCFSGLSSSGKSTAARQCRSMDLVSEDVVELRVDRRGRVWVHTTPINTVEKAGGHPFKGLLAGIYFVRKAKRIALDILPPAEVLPLLTKNAMMDRMIPTREAAYLSIITRVGKAIPCARLSFPLGTDLDGALEALHDSPSGRKKKRS